MHKTPGVISTLLFAIFINFKQDNAAADLVVPAVAFSNITTEKFQTYFLNEVSHVVERAAQDYLNQYLQELQRLMLGNNLTEQFQHALDSPKSKKKIIFIKQLLDLSVSENYNVKNFYTLRNVNFLDKFHKQLLLMQEEAAKEVIELRLYNLCKQFWFRIEANNNSNNNDNGNYNDNINSYNKKETAVIQPYHVRLATKLAPIIDRSAAVASTPTPPPITVNIEEFGRSLYANIKTTGAEIIDDYLIAIRRLLQEVIEERHEHEYEQQAAKLSKLVQEIDGIRAIEDFYQKRQRLYGYLEHDLAADYELFKESQNAEEDMADILNKLKEKGLDLFISFLFSNFEFLEHLQEEWLKLLPKAGPNAVAGTPQLDADAKLMHSIHTLYENFKRDSENNNKYEDYLEQVKILYDRTANSSEHMRVFELLHNASQNVGSVTFNMIRAKCDEIN